MSDDRVMKISRYSVIDHESVKDTYVLFQQSQDTPRYMLPLSLQARVPSPAIHAQYLL